MQEESICEGGSMKLRLVLTGLAVLDTVRELGVLKTALMFAGRSGSAWC